MLSSLTFLLPLLAFTRGHHIKETLKTTALIGYRKDLKCGPNFPLHRGSPSQCSLYGNSPCCDYRREKCGSSEDFCRCDGCTDFRVFNTAKVDESISLNVKELQVIIRTLTEKLKLANWITVDHVQYSKKIDHIRRNYVLIVRESLCSKSLPVEIENCRLEKDEVDRFSCFITVLPDEASFGIKLSNKDCVRASVTRDKVVSSRHNFHFPLEKVPRLIRYILIRMTKLDGLDFWYGFTGSPNIRPYDTHSSVFKVSIRVGPSVCPKEFDFRSKCHLARGSSLRLLDCEVLVRVSEQMDFKLLHHYCSKDKSLPSSFPFERNQKVFPTDPEWSPWSGGLCHNGVKTFVRFCYTNPDVKYSFECKEGQIDMKTTEC